MVMVPYPLLADFRKPMFGDRRYGLCGRYPDMGSAKVNLLHHGVAKNFWIGWRDEWRYISVAIHTSNKREPVQCNHHREHATKMSFCIP
jgi:hypothetical protein